MTTIMTTTSSHPLKRVTAVALAVALVGSLLLALVGAKPAQAALSGQIAYQAKDSSGNYQIYTISPDGSGSPTQVTSDPTNHFSPAYSPNGKTIAYQAKDSSGILQIYTIPADGSGSPTQVTSDPTYHNTHPAYSPNGKTIAYQVEVGQNEYRIYTIPADGNGSPKQLTSGGSPTWG